MDGLDLDLEIKQTCRVLKQYHIDLSADLNYFGILNEFEVYTGNFSKLVQKYTKKKLNVDNC